MKHLERSLDGQNQWWKYLIIVAVFLVGSQLLALLIGVPIYLILDFLLPQGLERTVDTITQATVGMAGNVELILTMFPFVVGLLVICCLFRWLHKRSFREIINGTQTIRWKRVVFAAFLWFAINVSVLFFASLIQPDNFTLNFHPLPFFLLIIIAVLLIPLQTTLEELVFRGYLAQGVAAATKSRWMALIIPSVLFASIHFANPEVAKYGFWAFMPQYLVYGLTLGLISILDDGIELAMGLHAANNLFVAILITFDSSAIATPALFYQKTINPYIDTVLLALSGILFVAVASKKYAWNFGLFREKVVSET